MSAAVAGPSRGGAPGAAGRGGRGGRGRGGKGGAGSRLVNMGAMTMGDIMDVSATQGTGRHSGRVPYPHMDATPIVAPASRDEAAIVDATLGFVRAQQTTPWWIRDARSAEAATAASISAQSTNLDVGDTIAATASLAKAAGKRGAADVLRYSDRKRLRLAEEEQARQAQKDDAEAKTLTSLNDPAVAKLLDPEAFPKELWQNYMQGETRRQERREDAQRRKRDQQRKWEDVIDQMESNGGEGAGGAGALNDNLSERGMSGDEDDDVAADEYEDDEEDDYADNYFDNGEDDDVGDLGGGGEAEADFD